MASDTTTSPDELGKLSFSDDPEVVAAVLANPSTPVWAVNRASARANLALAEAVPSRGATGLSGSGPSKRTGEQDGRMLEAQFALIDYVRAGLSLVLLVIVSSSMVTLGNQAEFQKVLACGGSQYCSEPGGGVYFFLGGLLSLLLLIGFIVYSRMGLSHRRRAGG